MQYFVRCLFDSVKVTSLTLSRLVTSPVLPCGNKMGKVNDHMHGCLQSFDVFVDSVNGIRLFTMPRFSLLPVSF